MALDQTKLLPGNKKALLVAENYETINRDVFRIVFPRIITDFKTHSPKAKLGDASLFYITLLLNVDGKAFDDYGLPRERFGACFLSMNKINEMTGISVKRMKFLREVLLENGLLFEVKEKVVNMRRQLWYYPSWCPSVSSDGYVINEDGERIVPNMERLLKEFESAHKR
ncbi:hypothetical protein [Rummeliibacillus sp. TYF-LIM-RU47]|uniref:hypothetical protein n=1 Tax=Rummeliibacillus sp. TYF-LIM-RU47 TaxID=2608406 RepID=UPI00123AD625|nr:hypothetical protein [Rummeliibacillus sp. TYF-LIM-RU47]